MMTLTEQIEIVRQAERIEIMRFAQTALMYACLTILICLLTFLAVRAAAPYVSRAFAALRRLGIVGSIMLTPCISQLIVYGSTKKTIITDLDVDAGPDSVICTWEEHESTIKYVFIQRRLKGATEEEAWEIVGFCGGGVKHLEIDGFTIDKDYEYRAKYIYAE